MYHKALEQNELRSQRILNQLYDDDKFDLDTWLNLLADCVVVNDQVCLLVALVDHVLMPHRTALTDCIFQQYLDAYDTLVKKIR